MQALSRPIQEMLDRTFYLCAALALIAVLLFPVTLSLLAVYGLACGYDKCKEMYEKRRNEKKTSKLLKKEDHAEATEALGIIKMGEKL